MKIMLFGRPGSGKSTYAVKLGEKLGTPVYHLDKYFYTANWIERDYQEFMDIQDKLVAQDSWILDGNSTRSLETRYKNANVCLYFNYPRLLCLWRILKRRLVNKDTTIHDRAQGCRETISWKLIKYMWTFSKRVDEKITLLRKQYPHVRFYEITSDKKLATTDKEIYGL